MELKLSNNDLRWAHWRNTPPEKRPKTQSFDIQTALESVGKLNTKGYRITYSPLKLNIGMSKEAAHFYLEMYAKAGERWNIPIKEIVTHLDRPASDYHGNLNLKDVQSLLSNADTYSLDYGILLPASILLSPSELMQLAADLSNQYYYGQSIADIFRLHIFPYLTVEEREMYRTAIRPYLNNNDIRLISVAGLIGGLDTELEHFINSTPTSRQYWYVLERKCHAIFGLSDPEKVKHYIRDKNIILYHRNYLLAWIAHTELDGLDWIAHSAKNRDRKTDKKSVFSIFKKIRVVEAVPHVLDLWQDPHLVSDALEWLVQNPEIVVKALTPIALSDDKQSKLATKYLRRMVSMGQVEYLEAALPTLDAVSREQFETTILNFHESDAPEFDDSNTPQWLAEACANQGKSKKTSVQWVDILSLPPLTIDGIRLNSDQIQHVLIALRGNNTPFLECIRQYVTQQERDDFMWALYQCWEEAGTPSKGKWAFDALGKLGGDTVVLKLMPLLKKWPGESKAKRASDGIKILQEIGTDTALMQINSLSQKVRYKSLKKNARIAMENIAEARGLSQVELEDRIIPDGGLDEDGTRVFDFGARQFTFVLSSDLKPAIRDENGKLRKNLPKPNKKDDEALAAQATADWKLIKKQVREVAKLQSERLEQAMISQRRWALRDFEEFYVKHPLMFHIVRLLLWGGYDAQDNLVQTFRIDEDHQIVDVDDEPIETNNIATVGVLHVMELDESNQQEWGDVLSDYEIISPFQQLSRKVSSLEDDELDSKVITRFAPFKVEPVIMVSILEKSNWLRGQAMDAGIYYSHAKYYLAADVTALVRYHGVPMGYWDFDKQGVDECFFIKGEQKPEGYKDYKPEQMMTLSEVSPVVMSETLRILHAIASKAE